LTDISMYERRKNNDYELHKRGSCIIEKEVKNDERGLSSTYSLHYIFS